MLICHYVCNIVMGAFSNITKNLYATSGLSILIYGMGHYMGLVARKPVFGVSDKTNSKPVCSATETS